MKSWIVAITDILLFSLMTIGCFQPGASSSDICPRRIFPGYIQISQLTVNMSLRCLSDTYYMQGPVFRCPLGPKVLKNFVNENYVSYVDIRTPLKELKNRQCYFKLRKATGMKYRFCCFNSSYQLEVSASTSPFLYERVIDSIF